ncbi:MAG: Sir2 family NAD-dependent protein deacetylase [Pseudomonadota bacterium]|nr:Sir2 family NAD-dependent protein deacetylase [Pseudomonadota bacterium]
MTAITLNPENPEAAAIIGAGRVTILSGAGISLASGIPTYRDALGQWLGAEPITHQAFMRDAIARRRYWARSAHGYPLMSKASPTEAHVALASFERMGLLRECITQNVDVLHEAAGHHSVLHLHGTIEAVLCTACGHRYERQEIQKAIETLNGIHETQTIDGPRPDGDIPVSDEWIEQFQVPDCDRCGGFLKPDVVFFGGNLAPQIKEAALVAVDESSALVVVGSSVQVFSGYRLCRRAAERSIPILLINPGQGRADEIATHRMIYPAETALPIIARQLEDTL